MNNQELIQNPYYDFLYQQYQNLASEKVILVTDEEMVRNIGRFIECFSNLQAFKIKHNNKFYMVLKYRQKGKENFRELMQIGKKFFDEGKYLDAIKCYELLNSLSGKNTAFCYSILAWSYFRINDFDSSYKYFVITNYLNKLEKKEFNLEGIITDLEQIRKRNLAESKHKK